MEALYEYIKTKYEKQAIEWQNEEGDKKLFSLKYFAMVEGLRSLLKNKNLYVYISLTLSVSEDEKFLKSILSKYK